MRRQVTVTGESHPDVPDPIVLTGVPLVWQIYVDGRPFLGLPSSEPEASERALLFQGQIISTGRYEYVDVRLRPERRAHVRSEDDGFLAPMR